MQRLRALRSRPPLVPKELIVPVCQRLAFVLFVMCGTALSLRIYALWKMGKFNHSEIGRMTFTPVNGTHFFLDIGNGEHDGISQTRVLEERGWKGICAGPNPEKKRVCKSISTPVSARDGEKVMVSDCSQQTTLQVLTSVVSSIDCPKVSQPGVGIADFLHISQAPRVIDYLSLRTDGSELSILNRFPFEKFCVRAWTVSHRYTKDASSIAKILKNQGCRVKEIGDGAFARCSCDRFSESLMHVNLQPVVGGDSPKRRKRSSSKAIVSSGMLIEEAAQKREQAEVDPLAEASHVLGGASGLGGSLIRRAFE